VSFGSIRAGFDNKNKSNLQVYSTQQLENTKFSTCTRVYVITYWYQCTLGRLSIIKTS
jgi:hypothetical protein